MQVGTSHLGHEATSRLQIQPEHIGTAKRAGLTLREILWP